MTLELEKLEVQDRAETSESEQANASADNSLLYDYPRRDSYDIQVYLARVLEIIEMGAFDSAVCSVVFTAETVMRLVAEQHSIDFESQMPTELVQTFLARSLIAQEDYKILIRAIDIRDALIHKGKKITIDSSFVHQAVEVVQHLLRQAGESEDEI
ncbi:MAG: hypothetical protein AB4426_33095 [Xenococcaceae cyanobacterium]